MKKLTQSERVIFRLSRPFKSKIERAAERAGTRSLSEYIRLCLIEKSASLGIKIKPNE